MSQPSPTYITLPTYSIPPPQRQSYQVIPNRGTPPTISTNTLPPISEDHQTQSSLHSPNPIPQIPITDFHIALPIQELAVKTHKMTTRSQTGSLKPRVFTSHLSYPPEPTTVKQALASPP